MMTDTNDDREQGTGATGIERPLELRDDQLKAALRAAYFAVEANPYERLCLWRESAADANHPTIFEPVRWKHGRGYLLTIGKLAGMPVTLELVFATINNIGVLFYHSPSQVTDYRMIEKWLDDYFPSHTWGGGRQNRCDAMNFHLCLHAIKDRLDYLTELIDKPNLPGAGRGDDSASQAGSISAST